MKLSRKSRFFLIFIFFSFLSINKLCCLVENAKNPKIIAHKNGSISAIWTKNDGTNDIIQTAYSSDFAQNWSTPINLSITGENAADPMFTNNDILTNLYAIWKRSDGSKDIIQFSSSNDFGINWTSPINLSDPGQNALTPYITTDVLNNRIYALWARSNGTNDIIQFTKSTDAGITWSTIEDLSLVGQDASNPQISIDVIHFNLSTIWKRSNGVNDIIQFRFSKDWGDTFEDEVDLSDINKNSKDPRIISTFNSVYTVWTQTDGSNDIIYFRGSKDRSDTWLNAIALSDAGQTAKDPQFIPPDGGQFIYAIWARNNGVNDIIQLIYSYDYGTTFSSVLDLSISGQTAKNPQLTSDQYGKYIYTTWARSDGLNDIIQFSRSTDFGKTFSSVVNLSLSGQTAKNPNITTDLYGQNIYVIWARSDGTKDVIQMVYSSDFGQTFSNPITISN